MKKFSKRTYRNPWQFFGDIRYAALNAGEMRKAEKTGLVSKHFRERLMLAVTAVNGCRYCSYFHTRVAMNDGLKPEEISRLLSGDVTDCPEDEAVALAYAQHWAESNAHPDAEALERLRETYGSARTEAIHIALRTIRAGNLMGNTFDYLLYRLSFGRIKGANQSRLV